MGGNPDKGKEIFKKKCAQCHTYTKGGGNKTGKLNFLNSLLVLYFFCWCKYQPFLWNSFGRIKKQLCYSQLTYGRNVSNKPFLFGICFSIRQL